MNPLSIEEQIKAEYGTITGWLATHPKASIAIAVVLAYFAGHFIWVL